MSNFPDARTDDFYNEDYLNDEDKEWVAGFDYAVEQVINLFENNADIDDDLDELLNPNSCVINVDKKEIVIKAIRSWMESERNMMIASMIDHMDDDLYEEIKTNVDNAREN